MSVDQYSSSLLADSAYVNFTQDQDCLRLFMAWLWCGLCRLCIKSKHIFCCVRDLLQTFTISPIFSPRTIP